MTYANSIYIGPVVYIFFYTENVCSNESQVLRKNGIANAILTIDENGVLFLLLSYHDEQLFF